MKPAPTPDLFPAEEMPFNLAGEAMPPPLPPCAFCKGSGDVPEGSNWHHYPLTEKRLPCPYCHDDEQSRRRRSIIAQGETLW